MINTILDTTRKFVNEKRCCDRLQFSMYGIAVRGGGGGAVLPKPACVGCFGSVLVSDVGETVSWPQVKVVLEVKHSKQGWIELVKQGAAYAQCMRATSSGRQSALVIGLICDTAEVRFLFFYHGGLISSTPFPLSIPVGWKSFITAVVGLGSIKDHVDAWVSECRNNLSVSTPVGEYRISKLVFDHVCLRGRGTEVLALELHNMTPHRHRRRPQRG